MLEIAEIFAKDAKKLLAKREQAVQLHASTNLRAAGNQVEISVRDYLTRMLPQKYYVGQGHLIDTNGTTSPQLDIIISDNENLPSLLKAEDGTEFIPFDSVYSVGEIKSAFYKSEKPISKFQSTITKINSGLQREVVPNTAYNGLKKDTLMRDLTLAKGNRVLNKLFSFMIFLDKGDFTPEFVKKEFDNKKLANLPNMVVILNLGVIMFASVKDRKFSFTRYPDESEDQDASWVLVPFEARNLGTLEGQNLAFLYYSLVEHLSNSHLEPASLKNFTSELFVGRKSSLTKIT